MASASGKSRYEDEDIKSGSSKMRETDEEECTQDYEVHTKKDAPPRFSTIFETKAPMPAPMPLPVMMEEPRRRRSGSVFISTPVFVLLVIVLILETMVIFAYTTIGLYNQLPGRLTMMSHSSMTSCEMLGSQPQAQQAQAQPAINFEPHIVVAAAEPTPLVQTVINSELMHLPEHSSTSSSSSISSTVASTTSSASTSSSPGMVIVTYTPGGGTLTSVVFVTPSAPPQTTHAQSTIFVDVTVGQGAATESSSTAEQTKISSTQISTSSSSSSSSTTTTPTTLQTSTTSITSTSASSTTQSDNKGAKGNCAVGPDGFNGMGVECG